MSHDINVLAEEIKNNNESSFKIFYDLLFPRLFRVAHYYLRNEEDAEEVVMDVFIKIWNKRKKLPEIDNLYNYTFTMVKNQSLNFLKKNKINIEDLNEYHTSTLIEYLEPEKLFLGKELARELEIAISGLPPRCQIIFRMVREEGLKYREVADTLGISLKAVENQLSIASQRIRITLNGYMNNKPKKSSGVGTFSVLSRLF